MCLWWTVEILLASAGDSGKAGGIDNAPPNQHRGAVGNPPNRFEAFHFEREGDWEGGEDPLPRTVFLRDLSSSIISRNDSPDVGFAATINPYRGCEHGCIYCHARPTHEYLGFSAGLDFESRILVKEQAPELLERELSRPGYRPEPLGLSGATDCYQPVERRLGLTRRCLEVLSRCHHPAGIVTKNQLVTRDADLIAGLAASNAGLVCISITSLDTHLRGLLEPRTSPPAARLAAIRQLAGAGIPVGVLVAPVIPGLTDHELPGILGEAAAAGASFAHYEMLRLPLAVAPLFEQWVETHFPGMREKIFGRIRSVRGGALNDPRFGSRMRGEGPVADQVARIFDVARRRAGLRPEGPALSTAAFRRPGGTQLSLGL